jgi:ribosomal protein S25
MGGFSAIFGVIGVGFQMAGAARQAKAQKMQLEAQAEQEEKQAEIAAKQAHTQRVNEEIGKLNAGEVRRAAQVAAYDLGQRTRQTIGAAKVAIASNGLVLNDPGTTPDALVNDLTKAAALDVTRIYHRARSEQIRALQQAAQFEMQADIFDTHEIAMQDTARHTREQAGMISPGLAAMTAGFSGLSNLMF